MNISLNITLLKISTGCCHQFFQKSIHKNGYSPLWIHVKKLTEEETFYFKTNISYNNIWQLGGEQKRLFETY